MFNPVIPALCLCLLAAPAWSQTDQAAATAQSAPIAAPAPVEVAARVVAQEKILVVGQRPGPGLWKISRGDHVLWIFGTHSPLPKNMQWRSQQVEAILAQSQEFLSPPSAGTDIGFFRAATLAPFAIGINKNPDGKTLRDVLPADVYARWLLLKAKYIGNNNGIERERPIFVADKLFSAGMFHAGLSRGDEVNTAIYKLVKKNGIKITASHITLALDSPGAALREFKKAPLDDGACFAKTLDRLETDIDAMRVRANAWATGNLEVIRTLSHTDHASACKSAMSNSTVMQKQMDLQTAEPRMRAVWLASAEKALAANASTFAALPIKNLLDPNGLAAALAAKGYVVEMPE